MAAVAVLLAAGADGFGIVLRKAITHQLEIINILLDQQC